MNYFSNCYTIHDAKKRFRELAQIHHPDKGGDSKVMAELIRQYDAFVPSRQPNYTSKPSDTQEFYRRYQENLKKTSTHPTQENVNSWNNQFGSGAYYNPHPRTSASFNGSIPYDHPVMVELRELRRKFNYGMEEENKYLKRTNEDLYEKLNLEREAHEKSNKRFKKIIEKLQGIDEKVEKPKKERLRKKSTKS